jgi:hypothetical protein
LIKIIELKISLPSSFTFVIECKVMTKDLIFINMRSFAVQCLTLLLLITTGCASNRENALVVKRKYRNGFHMAPMFQSFPKQSKAAFAIIGDDDENANQEHDSINRGRESNDHSIQYLPSRNSRLFIPESEWSAPKLEYNETAVLERHTKLRNEPGDPKEGERTIGKGAIGVIAIVLGILNLVLFMWVPFLGILSTLLCIVFAVKALKIDYKDSKALGGTSLAISLFTLTVSAFMTLFVILGLGLHPMF